ncbi:MAG: glycosyltransferase [Anaerolineaceae bacterium]|nr:glycosyltransferase [Anaerolineaceae bacterium]
MFIEALVQNVRDEIDSVAKIATVEHIVINDGSTDAGGTENVLNKYSHLHYWSRENRGQYFSMNEGLIKACGEWVCFICADDVMAQGTLRNVIDVVQEDPNCDGLWGRSKFIDTDGEIFEYQPILQRFLHLYKYISHIPHSTVYFKRSFLLNNRLTFDSQLSFNGDYDWFLRAIQKRGNLKFVDHTFVLIRKHENQTTNTKKAEILAEREIVHKKHKVSPIIYETAQFLLSGYSVIQRVVYRTKKYGISEGFSLLLYFIRHKLGINQRGK